MDVWERVTAILLRLLERYDDIAVFLFVLVEESGVPLPVPSDLVMVVSGYWIATGRMSALWALFLLESATLVGTSILYWLARRGGRPLVYRYGRYIHLDRERLDRAERWFQRYGGLAVVLGRIIPGLRIATPLMAGLFGIPYRIFLPAVTLGSFTYILVFVGLGYFVGPRALSWLHGPEFSLRAVMTIIVFLGVAAFLATTYRRTTIGRQRPREHVPEGRRLETTALAGFVATLEMWLAVNVVFYVLAELGLRRPEQTLVKLAQRGADRYFDGELFGFTVTVAVILFVGGIAWAFVYSHVAEPILPGPPVVRGLLFGILPFLFSALVLVPSFGGGYFGLALQAGFVPAIGELLRSLFFGVGLGTTYSLLRAARQPGAPKPPPATAPSPGTGPPALPPAPLPAHPNGLLVTGNKEQHTRSRPPRSAHRKRTDDSSTLIR
ncbi:MAG: DedA family protein [Chloroflexi bacterium]|nr:DedA family protein [Chloroflexota bacterium]